MDINEEYQGILWAIKKYFKTCPMIESDERVFTDFLPSEASQYAIYQTGNQDGGVIERFVDGSKRIQFSFIFASMFNYSNADTLTNLSNSKFFEDLQAWVEKNNEDGIFPEGITNPEEIEVLQTGSLFVIDPKETIAEYQMICRFIYLKEA